jgi:ribosomal protein S6E (S10)
LLRAQAQVTSGARAKSFPVSFTGVARTEESFEYAESSWDVAKDGGKWNALDGKRVSMKVVIRDPDSQYQLDDVKKEQFQAFTVTGVEGSDSGGLPMRMYVKRGTKHERLLNDAPSYSSGPPKAFYVVKGVVRAPRQMVVEVIERAD